MSHTIVIIGGLDHDKIMISNKFPEEGESAKAIAYHEALGGKGANSAIATYRTCHRHLAPSAGDDKKAVTVPGLDFNIQFIGAVGDDQIGARFAPEMSAMGVDCSGLKTCQGFRTSTCFVMIDALTRENRCLSTLGATASWKVSDFETVEQLGSGVRPDLVISQMELHSEIVAQMVETAGRAKIDVVLNAAPPPEVSDPLPLGCYRWITHLLVNETEAAVITGRYYDEVNKTTWSKICTEFIKRGVKNVVITLGAKGAYYANAEKRGHALAHHVEVVDATGAGDVFTGAYATEYLRQKTIGEWDIEKAVVHANKAAAIAITKLGAQSGIPWLDEIEDFDAPLRDPDLVQRS